MNNLWIVTFQSITYAQKAQRALKEQYIDSGLQRTPIGLSSRGCSYCLQLREKHIMDAVALLQEKGLLAGKVFARKRDGRWEERAL